MWELLAESEVLVLYLSVVEWRFGCDRLEQLWLWLLIMLSQVQRFAASEA